MIDVAGKHNTSNPLPNLPQGGRSQLFPLGGNGKGG
jgi:hypothetical protein